MLKKIIACVLVLAVLGFVPMMMTGCEQNEIKTHRQTEVRDRVVDQHTVVE